MSRPDASPTDLALAPQLAPLAILRSALRCSIASLEAAHPELHVHAWSPNATEPVRFAAALCASASALCRLLDEYESSTLSHIANDIPW